MTKQFFAVGEVMLDFAFNVLIGLAVSIFLLMLLMNDE